MSANIDTCDGGGNSKTLSDLVEALENQTENISGLCITSDELSRIESGMQRALLRVHVLQNSRSYINTVPDEILAKIIRIMVSAVRFEHGRRTPIRAANTFASVCRRWRLVVLHDVFLWTDIRFSGNAATVFESAPEYFARSKAARISVTVQMTESINMKILELMAIVTAQASRIRRFELQVDNWAFQLSDNVPGLSLPHVEELTINCGTPQISPALPQFFSNNLTSLRTLSMDHFTAWPPGLFVNLSTLSLHHQNMMNPISLSFFLDMLDDSPLLRVLSIINHGPVIRGGVQSGRISNLSHLRKLEISDCDSFVILSHIRVQPSTMVTVSNPLCFLSTISLLQLDNSSFSELFQTIPEDLSQLGMWTATDALSFDICMAEISVPFSFHIKCENSNQHGINILEDISDPNIEDNDLDLLESILESIRIRLPFPTVTSFSMRFDFPTVADFQAILTHAWVNAFTRFPNLGRLALHECVTTNVLNALGSPGPGDWVTVLPRLKRLELKLRVPASASAKLLELLRCLENSLQFRNTIGIPIRDLKLEFWYKVPDDDDNDIDEGICELPPDIPALLTAWKGYGVKKLKLIHNKVTISL